MVVNRAEQQGNLDEIESHVPETLHPILEAVFKNQKQVIAGVVAIIVAAALYAGINAYNQHAMSTAQAKLGSILIEAKGDDKLNKLEALLGSAPSSAKPAILLELAQSSMNTGQFDKAVSYWNQLVGEADDDMKIVARMGKAKSLTLAGKGDEAIIVLKDLAGTAPESFTVPVYRQLAVAAEQAGDTTTALDAYKKLADQSVMDKSFIDFKLAQLEAQ